MPLHNCLQTVCPPMGAFQKPPALHGVVYFTEDFAFFVFITDFSLFNFSNPVYHTEHGLASINTLPVRTRVGTKPHSGLVRVGLGSHWG